MLVLLQAPSPCSCRSGCLRLGSQLRRGSNGTLDEPDRVTQARVRAALAKARELAAHRRAEELHEKAPRRWSAWAVLTLRKRLGSERSAPGSCMPKRSGSKPERASGQPVRTASRAATGRAGATAASSCLSARRAGRCDVVVAALGLDESVMRYARQPCR